jgi:5-methylcytosine-specific restriction endonuclease McrA
MPFQRCQTCKVEKNLTEFSKNKNNENGHCKACKACENLRSKKRYQKVGWKMRQQMADQRVREYDKRIEIERRSRAKNIHRIRASKILSQAKRKKRLSECKIYLISDKDLKRLYTDQCYNCGSKENQSIDHRVPISRNGDHGIGNMMTLCKSCNASKKDRTIMEWKLSKAK